MGILKRKLSLRSGFALLTALAPAPASAHVKWFCTYDVTKAPKAFGDVMSPIFFAVLAAFIALLFLVFLCDGFIVKHWSRFAFQQGAVENAQQTLVRLGTGAFFLCTWTIGLNIITPELHTQTAWIFGLQFVIALCSAWKRTCIISAVGICVLYGFAVSRYGLFHMLDYVYFLGLAIFLAAISLPGRKFAQMRIPAMTACLAFSLIWTAVEKLLYPGWSEQLMEKHGHMMMGMPFGLFIVIAAFVEFTLAFYLATGRGFIRLGALALLVVFVSAMPEFGPRDTIGHLPLVAILGVTVMGGTSALQEYWHPARRGIFADAAVSCLLYAVTLAAFLGLYYGAQWSEYHALSSRTNVAQIRVR